MQRRRGPAAVLALAAVMLTVWFVGTATPARACTCARPGSEAELDAAAETIIIGNVTAVDRHDDIGEVVYTVRVEKLHKGEIIDPVQLVSAGNSAACGVDLAMDGRYKLYPRRSEDGRYRINLCDGNRLATDADLDPFDPVTTTTAAPATTTTRPSTTITTGPRPTFPSTTSTSSPFLSTTTTGTTAPPTDVAIDDLGDDDDGGGSDFLRTVGAMAVAGVGGAAIAVWYQRRIGAGR